MVSKARSADDEASRCRRGGDVLIPNVPVATAFTRLLEAHNLIGMWIQRVCQLVAGVYAVGSLADDQSRHSPNFR